MCKQLDNTNASLQILWLVTHDQLRELYNLVAYIHTNPRNG